MRHCHLRVLHDSPIAALHDKRCFAPKAGRSEERHAGAHALVFTRAGIYLTHQGPASRRTVAAEPAHVLLFNDQAPYRVSHPTDGGDATTEVEIAADVAREAAVRYDRAAWGDDASPFMLTHVLAPAAVLMQLHRLRGRLHAGTATAVEADETALEILDAVMRDAARARGARPIAGRPATRRARRELVEAVKERVAAAPGVSVSLAELAHDLASSPFHLTRTFRAETGLPVHQFHLRVRMATAIARLVGAGVSISALAQELGFSSHSHFTTAFRRVFGVTPSTALLSSRRLLRPDLLEGIRRA